MREAVSKKTVVRVPVDVSVYRGAHRGAAWSAEVATTASGGSWMRADGTSEAEAKAELMTLIAAGLAATDQQMVMVIGGSVDYADQVHLIQAGARGVHRYAINMTTGRLSCTSMTDGTVDDELKRTLVHVGGEPKIVRL